MSRCVVTVAIGARYQPYLRRQRDSKRTFDYTSDYIAWSEGYPPGSPSHQERHYAFKYHAVKHAALQGHDTVIWLDSSCHYVADPEPLYQEIERRGVYVVAGIEPFGEGGERLGEWISDQALAHFGVSRDEAMDLRLCGGAIVGLNMASVSAWKFMAKWGELAQTELFMSAHSEYCRDRMRSLFVQDGSESRIISDDPRVKGHRSDEACFSLMLRELSAEPASLFDFNKVIRSGYDIEVRNET